MKIVFVTGVSSGIGKNAIQRLVEAGYFVIGSVRSEEDAFKINEEFGGTVKILIFDVIDQVKTREEIESIYPLLEENGLYCLINNAGLAVPGPLEYLEEDKFSYQMDVNVLSVRRITNLLLKYLGTDKRFQPGKIINISSVSGLFNSPFMGAYCISKHALESMSEVYRRELMPFGIQVSAIEPGTIKTEIWRKNLGQLDRFLDTHYGNILRSADKIIEHSDKTGMDVNRVGDIILQILNSDRPKTQYLLHKKPFKFRILSKWLPTRTADKLIQKTLSKGDNYRPV